MLSSDLCAIGNYTALMPVDGDEFFIALREQVETLPWPPTSNDIPDFVEVLVRAGVEGAESVSAASIVAKVDPPVV